MKYFVKFSHNENYQKRFFPLVNFICCTSRLQFENYLLVLWRIHFYGEVTIC